MILYWRSAGWNTWNLVHSWRVSKCAAEQGGIYMGGGADKGGACTNGLLFYNSRQHSPSNGNYMISRHLRSVLKRWHFKAFVSISAICFSVLAKSTRMICVSSFSLMKSHFILMCFVRRWNLGFETLVVTQKGCCRSLGKTDWHEEWAHPDDFFCCFGHGDIFSFGGGQCWASLSLTAPWYGSAIHK